MRRTEVNLSKHGETSVNTWNTTPKNKNVEKKDSKTADESDGE